MESILIFQNDSKFIHKIFQIKYQLPEFILFKFSNLYILLMKHDVAQKPECSNQIKSAIKSPGLLNFNLKISLSV